MKLKDLKANGEAADWLSKESLELLKGGYLLPNETPRQMYRRVANSVASYLKKPELEEKFYQYIDKNWLCLSSPVAANSGTKRALPISCFSMAIKDTLYDIFSAFTETAILTKNGGGCGAYWSKLRQRGDKIGNNNGTSDGIIGWLKVMEATLQSCSQGGVRRGSGAQYLDITSNEIEEFIDIRRPTGDPARRCLSNNFHHAVCIPDFFMEDCKRGDKKARAIWERLLNTRLETGEPYIFFTDTVNKAAPDCFKAKNLKITHSNLCSEVILPSDEDHTFVCCLSSLNLARWDEWKDTDLIETSIWFLDGVLEEFIQKAESIIGMERAVRFAIKSRALGLGALGWHTLLQSKMIPFESYEAMRLNNDIFKTIYERSEKATQQLALEYGEPEWCKGFNRRNSCCVAVAPTVSNSLISGGVSQGIEPIVANYYAQKTAKGTFIRKNKQLKELLKQKGQNTFDIWQQINNDHGSVKTLEFLSDKEKEVFATARELNQFAIIKQAAQRQRWIDQGQSVNLFFSAPEGLDDENKKKLGKYIHDCHFLAWELGLKTLYYCRAENITSGDSVFREESTCKSCES